MVVSYFLLRFAGFDAGGGRVFAVVLDFVGVLILCVYHNTFANFGFVVVVLWVWFECFC